MDERIIYLRQSALKHHISAEDIYCAVNLEQYNKVIEKDEEKWLLLGFDTR